MNVVTPKLLLSRYPRANYLKREIEHVRRFAVAAGKQDGPNSYTTELLAFLDAAVAKLRVDLDTPAA